MATASMRSSAAAACVLPGSGAEAYAASIPDDPAAGLRGPFAAQQCLLIAVKHGSLATEVPAGVQKGAWLYEHLRLLVTHLNALIGLLGHDRACDASLASCRVMACGEVQYLCASHAEPRECCALDYSVHTVDGAATMLSSSRVFPSRVTVKADAQAHFPALCRRLYRVLSHAWAHHREIFNAFEARTKCTARFTALARAEALLASDMLLIPDADIGLTSS